VAAPEKPSPSEHLFSVGNFHELTMPEMGSNPRELRLAPPEDMATRSRIFEDRNSNENIKELCLALDAILLPNVRGLEAFHEKVAR